MKTEVLNLDALRAPSKKIQFLGHEFEVGYIPSGLAIPLSERFQALDKKQRAAAGGEDIPTLLRYQKEKGAEVEDDTIRFVADFCAWWEPNITPERVAKEADKPMVDAFFVEIVKAIFSAHAQGSVKNDQSLKKNLPGMR